jgi:hypothetical protein
LNISGATKKKNVKTISSPAESTNLIFQKLKCNPISGETVPLEGLSIQFEFDSKCHGWIQHN